MRIDLHTHSTRSDGTSPPGALLEEARAANLDVVAITDHDTTAGWTVAEQAADALGVQLVRGIELSTVFRGRGIHLLAYEPDPSDPTLIAELDRIVTGRTGRLGQMVAALRAEGVEVTEDDVRAHAADASGIGRPHVADALVSHGIVRDRDEAFDRWLGPGGVAYVRRYSPNLEDALALVIAAGGVPVIAHPWGRNHVLDVDSLEALTEQGLAGLEVDHQDHSPAEREELRAIARSLDLIVTGSSDYHGTGKTDHDLGVNTTAPDEFARLAERFSRWTS